MTTMTMTTMTVTMTMTMGRSRSRSRSRNLPGAGAETGKVKNDRLRQSCLVYKCHYQALQMLVRRIEDFFWPEGGGVVLHQLAPDDLLVQLLPGVGPPHTLHGEQSHIRGSGYFLLSTYNPTFSICNFLLLLYQVGNTSFSKNTAVQQLGPWLALGWVTILFVEVDAVP